MARQYYSRESARSLAIVDSLKPDGIAPKAFSTSARVVCFTVCRSLDQRSRPLRGVAEGSIIEGNKIQRFNVHPPPSINVPVGDTARDGFSFAESCCNGNHAVIDQ